MLTDKYSDWKRDFSYTTLDVDGVKTAVYCCKSQRNGMPQVVFLHGIGGDMHGMLPLTYEFRQEIDAIIVELPGHGLSGSARHTSLDYYRSWYESLVKALRSEYGKIDVVVAHSFATSCVMLREDMPQVILISPIPKTAWTYQLFAAVSVIVMPLVAPLYYTSIFLRTRVAVLQKVHTDEARQILLWIGDVVNADYWQLVHQALLGYRAFRKRPQYTISQVPQLIVYAQDDTMPARQYRSSTGLRQFYGPEVTLVKITGGHLAPLEDPRRVADSIRPYVIK